MALLLAPAPARAMHVSEGILPAPWALLWFALAAPLLFLGLRDIRSRSLRSPRHKPLVALVGAAVFIISCMPIPIPFAGTCSHPCGTGLAAILIGPLATVVVSSIALTLQALFLAHGGLTTLGANLVAMGVVGGFAGYAAFHLARRVGIPVTGAAFLAGALSDWATYATTSLVLAGGLQGTGDFASLARMILVAFLPTQLPLGILEGILSAAALRFVLARSPQLLEGRLETVDAT